MVNLSESLELAKLLRIDVYMGFFMFAYGLLQVPVVELVQEKICLNDLNQEPTVCNDLAAYDQIQSQVLSQATSIHNYQTLISTIPGVIQALFFGFWIDKYPSHIRILLVLPCIGVFIQTTTMVYQVLDFEIGILHTLWSYLAYGLGGGQSLVLAASFTYAAKKTPQKFRSIRFAIVDVFIFTAFPIGVNFGGKILAGKPWLPSEERNFSGVFLTAAMTMLVAIAWAVFLIDDSGPSNQQESKPATPAQTNDGPRRSSYGATMTEIDLRDGKGDAHVAKKKGVWVIAADIFDLGNVRSTLKTFLRKRDRNDRLKVILLAISVLDIFVSLIAESLFGFQYTEKAFAWDYRYYSNVFSLLQLAQSVGTVVGSMTLKNQFNLGDIEVTIIGTLSHFMGNLAKGIPSVTGYISGSLMFCFSGLAIPSIRGCITQIIDFNEIGQVLAIISCAQALGPLVATILTTSVFKATLDTAVGTTYHVLAALVVPPLFTQFWISYTTDKQGIDKKAAVRVKFDARNDETVSVEAIRRPEPTERI